MNTDPYPLGGTNLPPPPPPIYYPPTTSVNNYQQSTLPQQRSALQQQSVLNAPNVPASIQYTPPQQHHLPSLAPPPPNQNKLELHEESEDTASPISVVNKPTQETYTAHQETQLPPQYQQATDTQPAHTAYQGSQPPPQYHQDPNPHPAAGNTTNGEEPSSEIGYGFFGLIMAVLFGFFAFCFLCCAECMGLVGQRKKSFIIGAAIGVLLQSVIYIFLSFL